jgi:predicted TIM-barrel fold metal-dependent hydrolase
MPLILGHGHGHEGFDVAREFGNIYLDLCSSHPEQNIYRRGIEEVGADRIVFGTDLECFSPAFVLGSVWEAEFSEEEARKVFRENACRILGLGGAAATSHAT